MTENSLKSPFLSQMLVECDRLLWTLRWQDCVLLQDCISLHSQDALTGSFRLIQLITYLAATDMLIFVMVNTDWCTPFVFSPLQWRNGYSCIAWVLAQTAFSFLILSNFYFQCRQFRDRPCPC